MRTIAAVLVLMLCGCLGVDHVVGYGVMAATGAAMRKEGTCYAACSPGTVCNGQTGYCEVQACHARCRPSEICVNDGTLSERCEAI